MAIKKIKGFRTLNKKITEAFSGIVEDVRFRWSEEPCFRYDKRIIEYALLEGKVEDAWFNEFVEERFGYPVKNTFMITMLHEIGHYMTEDDVDGFVYNFCLSEKYRIQEAMDKAETFEEARALEWQYFSLPDEIGATAWAVTFAKNNKELLDEVWENILKALHEFYAKNITEEG